MNAPDSPNIPAILQDRDSRLAIAYVSERELMNLMTLRLSSLQEGGCITLPEWNLPNDAQVMSVFPCPARRSFGFVLRSEAFEQVRPCAPLPELPVTWRAVQAMPVDDGARKLFQLD